MGEGRKRDDLSGRAVGRVMRNVEVLEERGRSKEMGYDGTADVDERQRERPETREGEETEGWVVVRVRANGLRLGRVEEHDAERFVQELGWNGGGSAM